MVLILILGMFIIVKPVNAQETIVDNIEADFEIEFKTATDLKVRITADVIKIYLPASRTTYLKDEIKTLSNSETDKDKATMATIKYVLKDHLTKQIEQTFKNANINILTEIPSYDKNYFYDEYDVNLTSPFFGMSETTDAHDFLNGIIDMGAIVNYSFNLQADPGWNNTYKFNFRKSLGCISANTVLTSGSNTAEWKVPNGNGNKPYELASLKLKKNNPTTHDLNSENISLNFILNSNNVDSTSLLANVLIENADISVYNVLPSFIENLNYMPADGFRLFVNNSVIKSWEDVYNITVRPVEEKIKEKIENSPFNQTLDLIPSWDKLTAQDCSDPYSIEKMDSSPLLKAILTDNKINLKICDISNRAFFGLINAGAKANITKKDINFGDNLSQIGYDYNFTLYLPDNMYLDGKNVYEWNESASALGEFKSDVAKSYTKEKKETVIEIEIQNTDLNILSFFTGKTEFTFGMKMQENREYNVTSKPNMFNLPDKLVLSYLCSDAFRVCVEEKVFSQTDVDDYLKSERELFEDRLANILPSLDVKNKGNIKSNVFEDSLNAWDKNISNMDSDTAIKIDAYALTSHPISFGLSLLPPSFSVAKQYLNFTGIKDHNVTYRVIFPNDISIKISDSLGKAQVKTRSDGRNYIEISFNESEYNQSSIVGCTIIPSALFIFVLLLPCIISLILVVILIIVIILIRRKRKSRPRVDKTSLSDEEDETEYADYTTTTGYEDEDYYVPPPPGSKEKKKKDK